MRVATSAPGAGRTPLSAMLGCGRHFVGLSLSAASAVHATAAPVTPAADTINLGSMHQRNGFLALWMT